MSQLERGVTWRHLLQEAAGWPGVGDVRVVGVVIERRVEVTEDAAIVQSDLEPSRLSAAACYTLNTGALQLGHTEGGHQGQGDDERGFLLSSHQERKVKGQLELRLQYENAFVTVQLKIRSSEKWAQQ